MNKKRRKSKLSLAKNNLNKRSRSISMKLLKKMQRNQRNQRKENRLNKEKINKRNLIKL
jgi:hypothetical protein